MKIIAINASPKPAGAVATLTREVIGHVTQAGATVEELRLTDLNIGYCTFCMNCYRDSDSPIGRETRMGTSGSWLSGKSPGNPAHVQGCPEHPLVCRWGVRATVVEFSGQFQARCQLFQFEAEPRLFCSKQGNSRGKKTRLHSSAQSDIASPCLS